MGLFRFWRNPFRNNTYSLNELANFGAAMLTVLINNNPGNIWDDLIAALTSALGGLDSQQTNNITKAAIQKAQVLAKDNARAEVTVKVKKIYYAVAGEFGDNSPQLTTCFPNGLSRFHDCEDGELNNELSALHTALGPLTPPLAAAHATSAQAMVTSWAAVFGALDTAKGIKKGAIQARKDARKVLEDALFEALLHLGAEYQDDEAKFSLYVPEHLLGGTSSGPDVPEQAAITASPFELATMQVGLALSAPGATKFSLGRRLVGEPAFVIIAEDIVADANGQANFVDTLPALGEYEYQATGENDEGEGEPSEIVTVSAA